VKVRRPDALFGSSLPFAGSMALPVTPGNDTAAIAAKLVARWQKQTAEAR